MIKEGIIILLAVIILTGFVQQEVERKQEQEKTNCEILDNLTEMNKTEMLKTIQEKGNGCYIIEW